MKLRIALPLSLAALALAGCVAVPVGGPYHRGYHGQTGVYVQPSVTFRYQGHYGYRNPGYYGRGRW